MNKQDLEKIIQAGVQAPSGENVQPWRFVFENGILKVYNRPERDNSLYNYRQHASYFAIGAVLENIVQASYALGYQVKIDKFPGENSDHVANLTFVKTENPVLQIPSEIFSRATNRKIYHETPIPQEFIQSVKKLELEDGVRFILVSDQKAREELAKVSSYGERLVFGNDSLRQFFFEHIRFNEKQKNENFGGFLFETFELPFPAKIIFQLCRIGWVAKFLVKLGLPKIISTEFTKIFSKAPILGAVAISRYDKSKILDAGKATQKLWLMAEKEKISLHPSAGIVLLGYRATQEHIEKCSSAEQVKLARDYATMKELLGVDRNEELVFFFRLGYADRPTATSPKSEINVLDFRD